jgi:predicted TIM-barrel fold metal-dependent hydrolase
MIWDLHCHLAGVRGTTPEARAQELLKYADRMGIERLCVYMGLKWSHDPAPEDMRQQNDEVLQVLAKWPERFFGFVYLNPNHVDESLREFERCVRRGPMVGVKLWVARHCNTPELDPIVAAAEEMDAVVFQHTYLKITGNLPGESTPMELAELANRHPRARIICGHTGADWEIGIRAVRSCPNVWVDLAGSDPTAGMTEMAVRELGVERVLYGSDAGGRSFASQLGKVYGAVIPADAKQKVLGENLKQLLLPILKRKGVRL